MNGKLNRSHQYGLALKKALVRPRLECLVLGYLVQERHCGTAVNQRDGLQDGQMVGE